MTAYEMFNTIDGYKVVDYIANSDIITYKLIENYYYEDYIKHCKGIFIEITFDRRRKYLNITEEDCSKFKTITAVINMSVYKAINKQVEELGWLNENNK